METRFQFHITEKTTKKLIMSGMPLDTDANILKALKKIIPEIEKEQKNTKERF